MSRPIASSETASQTFCIAKEPTPLFNKPVFSLLKAPTLPTDDQGLFRPLEMIALPGTKFQIIDSPNPHTLRVATNDYPGGPYYLRAQSVTFASKDQPDREKALPPIPQILEKLESAVGLPYIWGGNWREGIGSHFKGLDCSGLLYEATNGYTARNTSELLSFGEKVDSSANVKRLDIVVWPGHVLIFFTKKIFIESLHPHGVILRNSIERLEEIADKEYVIRRFLPED